MRPNMFNLRLTIFNKVAKGEDGQKENTKTQLQIDAFTLAGVVFSVATLNPLPLVLCLGIDWAFGSLPKITKTTKTLPPPKP